MPHILTGGVPDERAGDGRLAYRKLGLTPATSGFELRSPAFGDGSPIPRVYTADGGEVRPPLLWEAVPAAATELLLIAEDPDAPTPDPFVHWVVHDIPPRARRIDEALASGSHEGRTTMIRSRWLGCAPPKGDLPHRYFFQLFAADRPLRLGTHAGRNLALTALRGHVLGCAVLIGTYRR